MNAAVFLLAHGPRTKGTILQSNAAYDLVIASTTTYTRLGFYWLVDGLRTMEQFANRLSRVIYE